MSRCSGSYLSIAPQDVVSVPSIVLRGASVIVRAVVRNLGEAPVSSFLVRFLEEGMAFYERSVSLDWESNVSVDAEWVPQSVGERNITVLVDPANRITEASEENNRADKVFWVIASVPGFGASTTQGASSTTLPAGCVMPGNALPCNEVSLAEVVSAISSWAEGGMQLNDVIDLINSWADQAGYPPQ
jgi:hypothetical protein